MKSKIGFTMVEIVIAMFILVIGFFPIYKLFSQSSGTAVNNIHETVATNYASDLVNFCKDLRYTQIEQADSFDEKHLEDDAKIKKFFEDIDSDLTPPPAVDKPFKRSMNITKYERRGWAEWIEDLFKKRKKVPSYLVEVKVTFPRMAGRGEDDVTLFTLIMD